MVLFFQVTEVKTLLVLVDVFAIFLVPVQIFAVANYRKFIYLDMLIKCPCGESVLLAKSENTSDCVSVIWRLLARCYVDL